MRGARVLALQRVGHVHAGQALGAIGVPHLLRMGQLLAQRLLQRGGQHHDPVLAALALAHDDGAAVEVDVLHAQAQPFEQAHAGAVEQPADDPMRVARELLLAVERVEQRMHLVMGQHRWQAALLARAADLGHPRQLLAQHLLVEEQQGRQRLAVRARRHLPVGRQPGEKGLDLGLRELGGVAQVVEADEGAHPVDVGVLGAQAVVQQADLLAKLIEQAWALWG